MCCYALRLGCVHYCDPRSLAYSIRYCSATKEVSIETRQTGKTTTTQEPQGST